MDDKKIIVIIIIRHQSGLDIPVSGSSNITFKDLPSIHSCYHAS